MEVDNVGFLDFGGIYIDGFNKVIVVFVLYKMGVFLRDYLLGVNY